MNLNFILVFAFVVTTISTTIFALSTSIGESIIKYEISSFLENELTKDYFIRDFDFNGRDIEFKIDIENREVGVFKGALSLENGLFFLNFKLNEIESKWIKKLRDIGHFSADGILKVTFFGSRVDAFISTKRESLKFKYRKRFLLKERYLQISEGKISKETFFKLTNLKIFGESIKVDGELSGNSDLMEGDVNLSIASIDMNGDLIFSNNSLSFSGKSSNLKGDIDFLIKEESKSINFSNVLLENIFHLFNINLAIHSRGDFKLFQIGNDTNFSGSFDKLSLKNDNYLRNISDVLQLDLELNDFHNGEFSGELREDFAIFSFDVSNGDSDFLVKDGSYDRENNLIFLTSKLSSNLNEIASIVYNSSINEIKIIPQEIGFDRLKKFIKKESFGKDFENEFNGLIELY
jgi:hypothetical protein